MRVRVLGAVEADVGGRPADLGTPKQRALLGALTLMRGRATSPDLLAELIWGDDPPPTVIGTLQAYVAGLRRVLEPGRAARAPATVLVTRPPGYALDLPDDAVDAAELEQAVGRARRLLGPLSHDVLSGSAAPGPSPESVEAARGLLAEALGWWRGTPYLELADVASAQVERSRLDEVHLAAKELAAVAGLAAGEHAAVAAELEALTAQHPLRERLWSLRALALARSGRQADALTVLRTVRGVLADELGIDPGEELRRVEGAVLRQDADVVWRPPTPDSERDQPLSPTTSRPAAAVDAAAAAAVDAVDAADQRSRHGARPATMVHEGAAPHPWPLVGRQDTLAALELELQQAQGGEPRFVSVVGEAGIGKSRLCAELTTMARAAGARILVGRCSQDEGAPALWPWVAVLRGLPTAPAVYDELTAPAGEQEPSGSRFSTWDAICRAVVDAAATETLVIVLDDLHWADASSLRVLRHLAGTADRGRLLVVTTWRPHPPPTGALAEVAEALARRHALRVDLTGLTTEQAGELLAAVAGARVAPGDAGALRHRTDGNPFYLVEYARLFAQSAETRPGLTPRVALSADLPAAVADVLARRLDSLPAATLALLRVAATLGRGFDLSLVARVAGRSEDGVLDDLEPALRAGLVVEDGVDHFRFAHALVRDAAYAGLPLSRRARLHARAADVLSAGLGTAKATSDVARHWLAAGPSHAVQAWTSAVEATAYARQVHAHEEAVELLRAAVEAQRNDPTADWTQRYDLLMQLADACRLAADWVGLTAAVDAAVTIAQTAGDAERAALAAVAPSEGALWQPRGHGEIQQRVVAALRHSLVALPPGDGVLRCRVMFGLASELYYASAPLEREALAEQALAMARRTGDQTLLQHALLASFTSIWRPATAAARLLLANEALEVATRENDDRGLATALTLQAVVHAELGHPQRMWALLPEALERASALRMAYLLIVLEALQVPWLAMAGRHAEAEGALTRLITLIDGTALPQSQDGIAGAMLVLRLFQGRNEELAGLVQQLAETTALPVDGVVVALLLRTGRAEDAHRYGERCKFDLSHDGWFSLLEWCLAGEAALGLGRPELGAASYAKASPFAGRVCVAGSGAAIGPVDAYLALAAAAAGEAATATRHADRALELCATWEIPLAAEWFQRQRDLHGF